MKTVNVALGQQSYPIDIDSGLLQQAEYLQGFIKTRQIAIVTQQGIADLYLSSLVDSLTRQRNDLIIETIILPDGEAHKTQATLYQIFDQLMDKPFSRDALLIALGGGIVGDIAGFAAATYQRGIDFIQMPTTLLAQVDSSVGGKTGINHPLGKNMIGAFYQPKAVWIDTNVLQSLPQREISAGMAEVIKYGLIRDKAFLQRLDSMMADVVALDAEAIAEVIALSCQHKADVVANDEKEKGERATLNLGHTFGHAIESLTHYQHYLHGEAVAIGTMMALELSQQQGWLSQQDVDFVELLFKSAGCPTDLSALAANPLTPAQIRAAMQRDKKVADGKLRLVLLQSLGQAVIRDDMPESDILAAIAARLS